MTWTNVQKDIARVERAEIFRAVLRASVHQDSLFLAKADIAQVNLPIFVIQGSELVLMESFRIILFQITTNVRTLECAPMVTVPI